MEYSIIIINRIKSLCQERNLSINKLASMSGLKQSTLDNIMRNQTKNPGIQTLHKIANGLSLTIAELLDIEELNQFFLTDKKLIASY